MRPCSFVGRATGGSQLPLHGLLPPIPAPSQRGARFIILDCRRVGLRTSPGRTRRLGIPGASIPGPGPRPGDFLGLWPAVSLSERPRASHRGKRPLDRRHRHRQRTPDGHPGSRPFRAGAGAVGGDLLRVSPGRRARFWADALLGVGTSLGQNQIRYGVTRLRKVLKARRAKRRREA